MKIISIMVSILVGAMGLPIVASADTGLANQNLQRALNELEAAKVYIQQAQLQTPEHARVVFHYDWLLGDVNKVEDGINQKFNQPKIQPRRVSPIKGDYIGVVGKKANA